MLSIQTSCVTKWGIRGSGAVKDLNFLLGERLEPAAQQDLIEEVVGCYRRRRCHVACLHRHQPTGNHGMLADVHICGRW